MNKYRKAFVAIGGGLVTFLSPFIPQVEAVATPEFIQALAVIVTSYGVWAVPNEAAETEGASNG